MSRSGQETDAQRWQDIAESHQRKLAQIHRALTRVADDPAYADGARSICKTLADQLFKDLLTVIQAEQI